MIELVAILLSLGLLLACITLATRSGDRQEHIAVRAGAFVVFFATIIISFLYFTA